MSVLLERDNCVFISHENYINNLYTDVNGTPYKINSALFAINKPFKVYKKPQNVQPNKSKECDLITNDISTVRDAFELFKPYILSLNKSGQITTKDEEIDNKSAIETSTILNEESPDLSKLSLANASGENETDNSMLHTLMRDVYLLPANCKFKCTNLTTLSANILQSKYDVILMDPPWWNKAIRRKNKKKMQSDSRKTGYNMIYNEDLAKLPIGEWLTQNGVVFIWCTNAPSHLTAIDEFLLKWGLFKCAKWYWLKVTREFEPIIPFGLPTMKQPFEQIIIASRTPKTWSGTTNKLIVSVPSAMHSHKPPLDALIKQTTGSDVQSLELFARYLLPGWTSVGNEVLKLQSTCFYTNT